MPTTIQATAKRYKLQLLLSALLVCIGFTLIILSSAPVGHVWGAAIAGAGLVWFLVARFLAWWNHG